MFSEDRRPRLVHKVLATLISLIFVSFFGYPLLLMISFFFSCKYYPYPIAVLLSYSLLSWVIRKVVSLYKEEESQSALKEQPLDEYKIDHELIQTGLEKAGDLLHSRQTQQNQMLVNPPKLSSFQTQPHQVQEYPPRQSPSANSAMSKTSECPPDASLSTELNSNTNPSQDSENLAHLLQPLQYSTEPLEDIPQFTSNVSSASGTSTSSNLRRKRQKPKAVLFHKPKQRKKKKTTPQS
ncbi:hypothetical protein HNY73_013012 [Argiope bruennichi]|uniref:Uncharacterized protein n=1 Tax=Argiope bruennichi TaxID=94029 RepID=A0A8T0EYU1_ARGBR|nr:hypothetical protein HNY73_013012 [Argiope bruennichi]